MGSLFTRESPCCDDTRRSALRTTPPSSSLDLYQVVFCLNIKHLYSCQIIHGELGVDLRKREVESVPALGQTIAGLKLSA